MNHNSQPKSHSSFTLTELLVVIGIIALVAAMTTVAVAPMMQGQRLGSGARVVQSMLYSARTYAATKRRPATVVFGAGDGSITAYGGDRASFNPSHRIEEPAFLPEGVDFATVDGHVVRDEDGNGAADKVVYGTTGGLDNSNVTGLSAGDNARIWLQGGEEDVYKVIEVVYTTGLTRIFDR